VRFFEGQLKKSNVDIRLGTEVTTDLIEEIQPDAVIIATGARPSIPFTPGVENPNVYTAIEVLNRDVVLEGKTAILGAGLIGLETALFLAENNVSPLVIIEPTDKLGGNVGLRSGWVIRNEVANCADIDVRTHTTVEKINGDSILVQKQGNFEKLDVKNVVIAVGMRNNNELVEELKASKNIEEVYSVGDCNIPRTMRDAIEEAAYAARAV
jgi:pyruvate/2-oxoglutarate dehydrogenase complex dihydrolipoamide dehydrogenase (E3) component